MQSAAHSSLIILMLIRVSFTICLISYDNYGIQFQPFPPRGYFPCILPGSEMHGTVHGKKYGSIALVLWHKVWFSKHGLRPLSQDNCQINISSRKRHKTRERKSSSQRANEWWESSPRNLSKSRLGATNVSISPFSCLKVIHELCLEATAWQRNAWNNSWRYTNINFCTFETVHGGFKIYFLLPA